MDRRVPSWFTGLVERLFFTILVGVHGITLPPVLMMTWIGLKLATNWNNKAYEAQPGLRVFAFRSLVLGLLSMTFALIGGLICLSTEITWPPHQ